IGLVTLDLEQNGIVTAVERAQFSAVVRRDSQREQIIAGFETRPEAEFAHDGFPRGNRSVARAPSNPEIARVAAGQDQSFYGFEVEAKHRRLHRFKKAQTYIQFRFLVSHHVTRVDPVAGDEQVVEDFRAAVSPAIFAGVVTGADREITTGGIL